MTAADLVTSLGHAITARNWTALRAVLADDVVVTYLHTGERLDAEAYVALNRDYPGDWTFHVDEVVDGGGRAVLRSRTVIGSDTWHSAAFATADGGRLVEIIEVWTEAVGAPPDRGAQG